MSFAAQKWYGAPLAFDPAQGSTVISPLADGPGWWAGACSAIFDAETRRYYLYYRLRKPRELGRGVECRVAHSSDGVHFEDVWRLGKAQLNSPSVERGSLVKGDGRWYLYLSYVDPADQRWRIDRLEGRSPAEFDPASRLPCLDAARTMTEGVKDPWLLRFGGLYWMLASYAPAVPGADDETRERMHASADVYNTGLTRSCTGVAVSGDGAEWHWRGEIFAPHRTGWDAYAARIACVVHAPPLWVAYYDGSADVSENYEERTGVAVSTDLRHFERVSVSGPSLVSPHASGSLRYMDVVPVEDRLFCYYEYARPDGSHELRVNVVPAQ